MSDLERVVSPLLAARRLQAHGEVARLQEHEKACWQGEVASCARLVQPYLEQGRDAQVQQIADSLCHEQRTHCVLALVLRSMPGDGPIDVSALPIPAVKKNAERVRERYEDIRHLLMKCRARTGAACAQLSQRVPAARTYLEPRACAWGDEKSCIRVRNAYGRRGVAAFGSLDPAETERVVATCPKQTDEACVDFYEGRADAVSTQGSDRFDEREAERYALYRAACDANPEYAVSACDKLARFNPNDIESLHFHLRACRAGDCNGLASNLRFHGRSATAQRAIGDNGMCTRALFEKMCLEGAPGSCRFLADELGSQGYSVGYDPAHASKLRSFAESLGDDSDD